MENNKARCVCVRVCVPLVINRSEEKQHQTPIRQFNVVSFVRVCVVWFFLDCLISMASFVANDVLSDIEKLETMLSHSGSSQCSSHSSCDSSSFHPPAGSSMNFTLRFHGSAKVYLRHLNKLFDDIEEKRKILQTNSGSILKRLQPMNNTRPMTFSSLFARPSIPLNSSKSISFSQLLSRDHPLSNPQSEYGCARLNEKLWVVHYREQLIKAVKDEYPQGTDGVSFVIVQRLH